MWKKKSNFWVLGGPEEPRAVLIFWAVLDVSPGGRIFAYLMKTRA